MILETEISSKEETLWKGDVEYKERDIRNGEILIFSNEVKALVRNFEKDVLVVKIAYKLFFELSIEFNLNQLTENVRIGFELPEHRWQRFCKSIEAILGRYLQDNNLITEESLS